MTWNGGLMSPVVVLKARGTDDAWFREKPG